MIDAESELCIIRAAQRDPKAFGPLYEAYADLVWRFCLKRLRSDDLAADACSRTFIKALNGLPSFEPRMIGESTSFRPWLLFIARNVVIDVVRRSRPTSDVNDPAYENTLPTRDPLPHDLAEINEDRRNVLAAIASLSPRDQRIVELRMHGYTAEEVAKAMNLSVPAVKSRHFRAYQKLRTLLAPHYGEGS